MYITKLLFLSGVISGLLTCGSCRHKTPEKSEQLRVDDASTNNKYTMADTANILQAVFHYQDTIRNGEGLIPIMISMANRDTDTLIVFNDSSVIALSPTIDIKVQNRPVQFVEQSFQGTPFKGNDPYARLMSFSIFNHAASVGFWTIGSSGEGKSITYKLKFESSDWRVKVVTPVLK